MGGALNIYEDYRGSRDDFASSHQYLSWRLDGIQFILLDVYMGTALFWIMLYLIYLQECFLIVWPCSNDTYCVRVVVIPQHLCTIQLGIRSGSPNSFDEYALQLSRRYPYGFQIICPICFSNLSWNGEQYDLSWVQNIILFVDMFVRC